MTTPEQTMKIPETQPIAALLDNNILNWKVSHLPDFCKKVREAIYKSREVSNGIKWENSFWKIGFVKIL
jgi:hypothetical protein